jgi:hypothetical protein
MTEVDADIVKTALDSYTLEQSLEPTGDAIALALKAALISYELRVIERTAKWAEALAETIMDEEVPSVEGAVALKMFAVELRNSIPPQEENYMPQDDDIVEVTLIGEVTVYDQECPECGAESDVSQWSVMDRTTGNQYWFDPLTNDDIKVRLISTGVEDFLPDML